MSDPLGGANGGHIPGGWTPEAYIAHNEAMRKWQEKYDQAVRDGQEKFETERDRRMTERDALKAEALKIKEEGDRRVQATKEEADRRALELVAENQAYKDEKANNLRSQIEGERGRYITRSELIAALTVLIAIAGFALAFYLATHHGVSQ